MRAAVIGHVEWIDFVRVQRTPVAGEIARAVDAWEEVGGGGAVAAVQLSKLAGGATLFTALGDDDRADRARKKLRGLGVTVEAVERAAPQRRALTFVDGSGERTITVVGERLAAAAGDPLPWRDLDSIDAVYVTAADEALLRAARRARVLVATSRILETIVASGVRLDAVVGSAADAAEEYTLADLPVTPALAVWTAGARGGWYAVEGGASRPYTPVPLTVPVVDTYGCGDSFAAGLTYGLGAGRAPESALRGAAACGAAVATGRGPYEAQLTQVPDEPADGA